MDDSNPSALGAISDLHKAGTAHVAKYAKMYAIIIVSLVIVILILSVALTGYVAGWWGASKDSDPMSNFKTGGNMPLWQGGGLTAGDTQFEGSLHEQNYGGRYGGSVLPMSTGYGCGCMGMKTEGMCSHMGKKMGAMPGHYGKSGKSGKSGWSYGATAELDAQVQAGNYAAATPGYSQTQTAIDGARSPAHSEEALQSMLGGAY